MRKPMIVQLSNKQEVKITSDELEVINEGINTGSMIKLRRGIVNPSFIVSIVPDTDAWKDYLYVPGLTGSKEWGVEKQKRIDAGYPKYKDHFNFREEVKKLTESKKM